MALFTKGKNKIKSHANPKRSRFITFFFQLLLGSDLRSQTEVEI